MFRYVRCVLDCSVVYVLQDISNITNMILKIVVNMISGGLIILSNM